MGAKEESQSEYERDTFESCWFHYPTEGNIKKNEDKNLIQIRKEEALKLNKMGVPFGENGISTSHSSNKKYYLCEKEKNLKLYNKIRK